MRFMRTLGFVLTWILWVGAGVAEESEKMFTSLFDGTTLNGWILLGKSGSGYLVRDGKIVCPPGGGGNLLTEKQYEDFILRFEFKLEDGSNNGLAIRSPLKPDSLAYEGMEIQIIDDQSERYKKIQPWQRHGSLYHVFPSKTGHLEPTGEWNEEEVTVLNRSIKVVLNGHQILNVDLDDITDPAILEKHPGLQRRSGHLGFLGHDEPIEFRNIRIKEIR